MGARCTFTTPAPVTAPPGWLSSGSTAHRAPAHHPSRRSPPRPSAASAGSRMIGRGTEGQLRNPAATWRQRRPTSPASPTRWASTSSRSWVILAAGRTPWPAPRSGPGVSWPQSACLATDQGGIVDDDLAYVTPWGCDPRQIGTPVLFIHGAQDRLVPSSHAIWLAQRCRTAELWLRPGDGHVSILNSSVMALDWLREHASYR